VQAAVSDVMPESEPIEATRPVERRKATARYIFLTDQEPLPFRASAAYAAAGQKNIRVAWRVLAANNRPLGRSTAPYSSVIECHATLLALHHQIAETSSAVFFSPAEGCWGWTLSLGGVPVAQQVHLYQRRFAAHQALKQFLAVVATVCPVADSVRPGGRRAMIAYDLLDSAP
jgi:hypothetical protein